MPISVPFTNKYTPIIYKGVHNQLKLQSSSMLQPNTILPSLMLPSAALMWFTNAKPMAHTGSLMDFFFSRTFFKFKLFHIISLKTMLLLQGCIDPLVSIDGQTISNQPTFTPMPIVVAKSIIALIISSVFITTNYCSSSGLVLHCGQIPMLDTLYAWDKDIDDGDDIINHSCCERIWMALLEGGLEAQRGWEPVTWRSN